VTRYVLGVNAFHGDASACLLADGELVAAAEEERFRRIKHWAGFPSEAISWCLRDAGIGIAALAHVGVNQDSRAALAQKIRYSLISRPSPALLLDRLRNKRKRVGIAQLIESEFGEPFRGEVHFVEHHLAHLASAYFVSPFDDGAVVSVDGFGDFASAAWGRGQGNSVAVDERIYFPHSLGIFYEALTQYLGFPHYGDEYKVMGLAPYGEPRFLDQMRRVVLIRPDGSYRLDVSYFRHAREKVAYEWENGQPAVGTLFAPKLESLLGPARRADEPLADRHRDIARSVQAMYEDAVFALLNAVHRRYGSPNLAIAGGCAMNSVANGKVYARTPFRRLYVQSAAGDAGGAIGAALVADRRAHGDGGKPNSPMSHAYWGPRFSDDEIDRALADNAGRIAAERCVVTEIREEAALCSRAAAAIAEGRVVGWFQGRMEWGPRALGNRSILADPRRTDMKDILNLKIKRRESFRPFAPSILREAVGDWFETDDDVPFMMQVYQIRPEMRGRIPAVAHVDGSGRLQTVSREVNPLYYRLIDTFAQATGVPMLLNTSFNENEPIVCRPQEALDCFLRTKMDILVLGSRYLERKA
jgi:carbamoyltransferase